VFAESNPLHTNEVLSPSTRSILAGSEFSEEQKAALADLLSRFYRNLGRCFRQTPYCVAKLNKC
jgi:galactose-1-phosphate uridylyltransferase